MRILEVKNLVKVYGKRRVVNQVNFFLNTGEIIGLLGRNGAGKTTTFKMTMGMVTPNEGSIFLADEDITYLPIYKRARKGLGYLAQEPSIFRKLTVEQNLTAILETLDINAKEIKERCRSLLQEYGLLKLAPQRADTLSGGETRRLEISRALATSPKIIMLDEPFSGVDPIAVTEIKQIIVSLKNKGMGIILTDHNVRETLTVTDRSYIIDDGEILASGPPLELVENPIVRQKYLGKDFKL